MIFNKAERAKIEALTLKFEGSLNDVIDKHGEWLRVMCVLMILVLVIWKTVTRPFQVIADCIIELCIANSLMLKLAWRIMTGARK